MSDYLEKPGKYDNIMYIALGLFFLAFLVSVPFMWHDKQARLEKAWQDDGCQMYDDYLIKDVPAKCQTYFVDHYKPQQGRIQPPEAK